MSDTLGFTPQQKAQTYGSTATNKVRTGFTPQRTGMGLDTEMGTGMRMAEPPIAPEAPPPPVGVPQQQQTVEQVAAEAQALIASMGAPQTQGNPLAQEAAPAPAPEEDDYIYDFKDNKMGSIAHILESAVARAYDQPTPGDQIRANEAQATQQDLQEQQVKYQRMETALKITPQLAQKYNQTAPEDRKAYLADISQQFGPMFGVEPETIANEITWYAGQDTDALETKFNILLSIGNPTIAQSALVGFRGGNHEILDGLIELAGPLLVGEGGAAESGPRSNYSSDGGKTIESLTEGEAQARVANGETLVEHGNVGSAPTTRITNVLPSGGAGSPAARDQFYEISVARVQENASAGSQRLELLNELEGALSDENLYTGAGGNFVQWGKTALKTALGVDIEGETSGEIIQNLSGQFGLNLRSLIRDVQLTETEYQRFKELSPHLGNSRDANMVLITLFRRKVERDIDARNFAAQWEADHADSLSSLAFERDLEVYQRGQTPLITAAEVKQVIEAQEAVGGQNSPAVGTPFEGARPEGLGQFGNTGTP